MTTILVLNAVSSLLAIGGLVAEAGRQCAGADGALRVLHRWCRETHEQHQARNSDSATFDHLALF